MTDIADTAISVTNIVGGLARFGRQALPVAEFLASFIPGAGPIVMAVQLAMPYIEQVAAAAPVVASAIDKGRPVFNAIHDAAPSLMPDLKALYAIAVNHDPAHPESDLKPSDVTDSKALAFAGSVIFGRAWSTEETQRWWDKAQGVV